MAKYNSTVNYNIKTTLDASGLTKLHSEISKVQGEFKRLHALQLIDDKQYSQSMTKIHNLSNALNKSFNSQMGMINFGSLKKELSKTGTSISDITSSFKAAGSVGDQALNNLIGRFGKIDTGLQSVSKSTDKLFNTIGNTVRWGIVASGFQSILNSAHQAVQYMKDLDESLTNIRMVTDYSKEEMREFALYANEAAKALGSTTTAYTNASLIFAQQGFNLEDATALGEYSIKLANVTGQDTATTSNQLTSYMNAYGTDLEDIGSSLDKWAEVANVSAADVKELSVATQKAGSTAATVGVNMDQLAAQIATIESVTRDAPENIGNGLKTIYARFSDLSLGETLEDGMDLGKVSGTLESMGVEVIDKETGVMSDVGDIIENFMEVWDTLDQGQKAAAAQTLAGKYQMNRLMALMENSDMYDTYKESSESADGTLDTMQSEYLESIEGRLNTLKASAEGAITTLFDQDSIGPFISGLTEVIDKFTELTDAVGGGSAMITALGATAMRVFNDQIGRSLTSLVGNMNTARAQAQNATQGAALLQGMGLDKSSQSKSILNFAQFGTANAGHMSQQQQEQYNNQLKATVELKNKEIQLQQEFDAKVKATNATYRMLGLEEDLIIQKRKGGIADLSRLSQVLADSSNKVNSSQLKMVSENLELIDNKALIAGQAITKLSKQVSGANFSAKDFRKGLTEAQRALTEITKDTGVSAQSISHLQKALDAVKTRFKDNSVQTRDLKLSLEALSKEMVEFQQLTAKAAANPSSMVFTSAKTAADAQAAVANAKNQSSQQNQVNQGFMQSFNSQQLVSNISSAIGAVGQLAFAWQSFQNLGSIWKNEDLEFGEKFGQTVMNLGMTLPMLVFAITPLLTLKKELLVATKAETVAEAASNVYKKIQTKLLTQEFVARSRLRGVQAAQINLAKREALAQVLVNAGHRATAQGIMSVVKAKLLLNPLLTAGIAALAAAAIGIGAYNQKLKEQREANKEAFDSHSELTEEIKSSYDALDQQYKQYQETGRASDELTKALLETADALGLTNAELILATEGYSGLKAEIDEATASQLKYNVALGEQRREDIESERYNTYAYARGDDRVDEYVEYNPYDDTVDVGNSILNFNDAKNDLKDENITLTNQKRDLEISKAYASDEAEIARIDKEISALDQQIADNNLSISKINETMNEDDVEYIESRQQNLEESFQADLIQGNFENMGSSIEDIRNSLLTNTQISEEYDRILNQNGEAAADAWLMGWATKIAEYNGDEDLKEFAENTYVKDDFESQLKKKFKDEESYISEIGQTSLNENGAEALGLPEGTVKFELQDGWEDIATQQLIEQIEQSSLSEEQKLELMATIDWEQSLPVINGQIQRAIETGEVQPLTLQGEFDPAGILMNSQYSTGEVDSMLADTEIDKETFDAYAEMQNQAIIATGEYKAAKQEAVDGLQKAVDDATAEMNSAQQKLESTKKHSGENSVEATKAQEEYDKAVQKVTNSEKRLERQTKNLEKGTKDIAAASFRASKGFDEMAETAEEDIKSLKTADKTSLEYADALGNIKKGMSEVLGLNVSELSTNFIEDNIQDIEDFVNQTDRADEALENLRIAAAKDIVQNMEINPTGGKSAEEIQSELDSVVEGLAENVPALGIPVDVESDEYFKTLNQMLASGQITADQANDLLSSIGYDADIGTETVTTTQTHGGEYNVGGTIDKETGEVSEGLVSIPWSATTTSTVEVPKIEAAKGLGDQSSFVNPGVTSGKKGSTGGGSSGAGKGKSATKKDKKKHEKDPYKKVNRHLDKLKSTLGLLTSESDRLFGADWRKNLEEQNELLDQQIAKLRQKLAIQEREQAAAKNKLAGQGIQFDQYGAMTNYDQVRQRLIDDYNRIRNSGNEEAIKRAEEAIENFDSWVEQYETATSGIEETNQAIADSLDMIEDNAIALFRAFAEGVETIKELHQELDDFEGAVEGFKIGDMDDPFVGMRTSADKTLDYFDRTFVNTLNGMMGGIEIWGPNSAYDSTDGQGHGTLSMSNQYAQNVLAEVAKQQRGEKNQFGENTQQSYEALVEAEKMLRENITAAMEEIMNLQEQILAAEEKIAESIDERQEQYQAINDTLEYQKSLTEMLYGEEAYDLLNQIYEAQQKNTQAMLYEKRLQKENLQQQLRDMEANGQQNEQLYKALQSRLMETEAEIQDLVIQNMELIREQYEKTVDAVLSSWTKNAFNGTELDWLETEWELIERNSEQYLDNVNAAYETQKLQSKYIQLLDGETNLHNQQLITEQMNQQLEYLREKDKLSEYDVAYANAQLEILQKRIALEDARNNKSQMKLKRDSQGNYGYVYTANEEDVASAEGDLLDAENEAYNLSKDNMIEMQNNSMSALKDAYSTIQGIWTNANLTLEEKSERTQTVIESLKEYLTGAAEQLSVSEQNLINDFFIMVEGMSDENTVRLSDAFDEMVKGNYDALDLIDDRFNTSVVDWLKNLDEFEDGCTDMMAGLVGAAEEMESDIDDVSDAVGQDFTNITKGVEECNAATRDLTASTEEFFEVIAGQSKVMQDYQLGLESMRQELIDIEESYNATIQALQAEIEELRSQNSGFTGSGSRGGGGNPPANGGGGGGNPPNTSGNITGKSFGYKGMYYHDSWGMAPAGDYLSGQKGKVVVSDFSSTDVGGSTKQTGQYKVHIETQSGGHLGWIKKSQLFDTGGYTGAWNDGDPTAKNGKLAYLHQKELVLNENDTKNLLAAIEIVRGLTDSLKNSSLAQLSGGLSSFAGSTVAPETIEQRVSIEASFPNVKDSSEIETALLGLSDQAYQWAHRYR